MFLSPRWPAAAAISDFYNGLKKTTIKDFLMVANWTPSPQNLYIIHPLDLIVLHKPVEGPSTTGPGRLTAHEVYDESDLVLSKLLGDDQPFNNQMTPQSSPWDNFWDIGGSNFEPRVTNWLEMTAPGPPMEPVPVPAPVPVPVPVSVSVSVSVSVPVPVPVPMPVENYIETPVSPMTMSSPPPPIEINFEALKNTANLLPACNRCRTRRIKCERVSLECQQCKNSESTCVYFDQLLSKNIACRSVETHPSFHSQFLYLLFDAERSSNNS